MKKKTIYLSSAISLLVLLGIGFVAAQGGFGLGLGKGIGQGNLTEVQIGEMQTFQTNLQAAIANNDYSAWKSLIESQLTEERFQQLVEKHSQMAEQREIMDNLRTAIESGDTETVQEIRAQMQESRFGPSQGNGQGVGSGMGEGRCTGETRGMKMRQFPDLS